MKHLLLAVLIGLCQLTQAQVPSIDYSFQAVTPVGVVNKILVLPDGKILVGGAFYNYAGTQVSCLVRLHPDGTLDNTWNPGAFGLNGTINDMELMPDGKIMIGGTIISYNGVSCGNLVRLNPDGTRDASFMVPFGTINGAVLQLELHMDGKVLAAGEFQHCYGISQPHIARFNYDGSLDTTFNIGQLAQQPWLIGLRGPEIVGFGRAICHPFEGDARSTYSGCWQLPPVRHHLVHVHGPPQFRWHLRHHVHRGSRSGRHIGAW